MTPFHLQTWQILINTMLPDQTFNFQPKTTITCWNITPNRPSFHCIMYKDTKISPKLSWLGVTSTVRPRVTKTYLDTFTVLHSFLKIGITASHSSYGTYFLTRNLNHVLLKWIMWKRWWFRFHVKFCSWMMHCGNMLSMLLVNVPPIFHWLATTDVSNSVFFYTLVLQTGLLFLPFLKHCRNFCCFFYYCCLLGFGCTLLNWEYY